MDFYLRLSSLNVFLRFTHIVVAMYPLNKYKQKFLSSCKPMSSYSRLALLSNKIPCAIPCDSCITLCLGLGFPSSEPLLMLFLPTRPWILPVHSLLFLQGSALIQHCPEPHVDHYKSLPELFLLWTLICQHINCWSHCWWSWTGGEKEMERLSHRVHVLA